MAYYKQEDRLKWVFEGQKVLGVSGKVAIRCEVTVAAGDMCRIENAAFGIFAWVTVDSLFPDIPPEIVAEKKLPVYDEPTPDMMENTRGLGI